MPKEQQATKCIFEDLCIPSMLDKPVDWRRIRRFHLLGLVFFFSKQRQASSTYPNPQIYLCEKKLDGSLHKKQQVSQK